jgi:hypothetical protein
MPVRTWQFRAEGVDDVVRGHERIRQSEERLGRSRSRGAGGGGSYPATGRGSAGGGKSPEVKAAEAAAKAVERAEKEKQRAITRAASASEAARIRGYKAESRALDRAEADKSRIESQHQRTRDRIRAASFARDQRESAKHERQKLIARKRMWGSFEGPTAAGAGRAIYGIGGAAIGLGIAAGAAGVGVAGAAVRNREAARGQAVALSVAGRGAGENFVSPDQLLGDATKTALGVRGTKTGDVLASMQKYVQMTGDLAGARSNARTFAVTARATGSSEEEIAATAATMREKFGVKDPDQMRQSLARMTFQGKSGAFEMRDASQYFTELGAAGSRFGLDKGTSGIATLGGLSQLAMKSAGSGAKASTGVQAMLRQLVAKSSDIKAVTGTDVFTDATKTKTNNVQDVLTKMIGGAGGNQQKLQKILGDEGMVGASALITAFNEAANATKKGASETERRAAGEAAVRRVLDETINAGGDWAEVQKDAAAATDTASAKLTTAWETIASQAGDALLPSLTKLAGALALGAPLMKAFGGMLAIAADDLGGFIKWLQKHDYLDKDKEPTEGDKSGLNDRVDYSIAAERIAAIKKGAKGRKLTPEEEKQLSTLESERSAIKERAVARDPSLAQPLMGPYMSPEDEDAARFGVREEDRDPVTGIIKNDNGFKPTPMTGAHAQGDSVTTGNVGGNVFDEFNQGRDFAAEEEQMRRRNLGGSSAIAESQIAEGRGIVQKAVADGKGDMSMQQLMAAMAANTAATERNTASNAQFSTAVKGG